MPYACVCEYKSKFAALVCVKERCSSIKLLPKWAVAPGSRSRPRTTRAKIREASWCRWAPLGSEWKYHYSINHDCTRMDHSAVIRTALCVTETASISSLYPSLYHTVIQPSSETMTVSLNKKFSSDVNEGWMEDSFSLLLGFYPSLFLSVWWRTQCVSEQRERVGYHSHLIREERETDRNGNGDDKSNPK